MKRYFYLFLAAFFAAQPFYCSAQTHIKDDFLENTTLDWTEFADKSGSGLVQNGYLELISKNKETSAGIWTDELPVIAEGDYTVKAEMLIPKLTSEYSFGIIFNRNLEDELGCFLFSSKNCASARILPDRKIELKGTPPWPIKLVEGKDKEIIVEIKQQGGRTIISVNDMLVSKTPRKAGMPAFGFWTPGDSSLRVTKVEVDQDYNPTTE